MKSLLMLGIGLVLTSTLIGCAGADGDKGDKGDPGITTIITTPPPVVTEYDADIARVIQEENDYRLGLGQTMLSSGLACTLYSITGGDRIQASIAGHNTLTGISQVATYLYKGLFNQPDSSVSAGMSVLPPALRSIYTNMYLLRCQGSLVVLTSGYYSFELTSDDGSLLYVDGAKVIDNDNNHGATLVSGMKYLRRGVRTFRLDYAQSGAGNQALIFTSGGASIDPKLYLH